MAGGRRGRARLRRRRGRGIEAAGAAARPVDLDAERARLDKEIARVSGEKDKSEAKLAKFTDKVPPAVVEQERQRLADWSSQLAALHAQRAKL